MEQLHAHEVLHMMEGNSYSESSLREAIINKFGSEQRFYACSADNMNVDELISFLNRYKDKDPRVRVFAVEQLNVPVVLYFKFNIPGNNIRI